MGFALDISIALAWCFSDESTVFTSKLLDRLETEIAFVPNMSTVLIINLSSTRVKKGQR